MENSEIITEATKYIEELFCENHDGHDADDYKLFSTENNYNARSFMEKMGGY